MSRVARQFVTGLVPALLMLGAAGCATPPAHPDPEVAMPAGWSTATPVRGVPDEVSWWHSFSDPQLEALLDEALRGSADLRIALDHVAVARDTLREARSHRWPTVDLNGNPTDPIASQLANVGGGTHVDVDSNLFELSVDAAYEVDLWGRVASAIHAAEADHAAVVFDAGTVQVGMATAVARSYFELRSADEEASLAERRLALAREREALVKLRFDAGRIAWRDVAAVQRETGQAQADVVALHEQRTLLQQGLSLLVGRNPGDLQLAPAALRTSLQAPAPPLEIPERLVERRPDLQAARQRLDESESQVDVARADLRPRLTLIGRLGVVTGLVDNLLSTGSTLVGVGPDIVQPLFDGGRRRDELDASQHKQDAALAEYEKAVRAAFGEVERALLAHQAALEDIARRDGEIASQRETVVRESAALAAGRRSRLDLVEQETRSLELENAAVRAYRARLDSLVALYQAAGGGWEPARLPDASTFTTGAATAADTLLSSTTLAER